MSIFSRFKNQTVSRVQLVTERGNGFYAFDGRLYQSDIVRACLRPKVKAVGKLTAKHVRETLRKNGTRKLDINPEPYIRFLLEEPNPYMTGQMLQEKLATQLALNKNAFALIIRDDLGFPAQIYPIIATGCDAVYNAAGDLFLRFYFRNGKTFMFSYDDIIHLREDYNEDDIFGTSMTDALTPLMNLVTTTDQGIIATIKNSAIIRWLLKFTSSMRPEDIEDQTKRFANSFLSVANGTGVAGVDAKAEAIQIHPDDFVPNASQMDRTTQRIYALFNTNAKIVDSSRDENAWVAYIDSEIEPVLMQLSDEYTRKIFSRKERGFGNRIVFEASAWDCASTTTKLALVALVDRGALTPNEWRSTFNLAPVPGGDNPIRRLDTQPTTSTVATSAGGGESE